MSGLATFYRRPRSKTVVLAAVTTLLSAACGNAESEATASAPAALPPGSGAASLGAPTPDTADRPERGTAWVIFGADTVVAEVAQSNEERARGLMYREEVPDGTGMLFVFPDLSLRSFWMQNTYVALDIAYMGSDFRIVDIRQMEPLSTESVPSRAPAQYALEVRQGWFAEKGIEVGALPEVVFGN